MAALLREETGTVPNAAQTATDTVPSDRANPAEAGKTWMTGFTVGEFPCEVLKQGRKQ